MAQDKFRVSDKAPLGLFLRTEPVKEDSTKIAVLPMGQVVTKIAESETPPWWEVSTVVDGVTVSGFISSRFLVADSDFEGPPIQSSVSAVHLRMDGLVKRSGTQYAFALNEPEQPTRNSSASPDVKAKELGAIINWLNVEVSARYQPKTNSTYCNIYGYDYCYLSGVFLPRVWWLPSAIAKLRAGRPVSPLYAQTVAEVNANGLLDWMKEYGTTFGWRRSFDVTELQNAANEGQVVVIMAKNRIPNNSGHLAAVTPETSTQQAVRSGSTVVRPLQTQAGRTNKKYWTPNAWWVNSARFKDFGFWINAS